MCPIILVALVYNNTIVMASDGRWAVNIPSSSGKKSPVRNQVVNNILWESNAVRGSLDTYSTDVWGFKSDHNVLVNRFSINSGNTTISLATWQYKTGQDVHSVHFGSHRAARECGGQRLPVEGRIAGD